MLKKNDFVELEYTGRVKNGEIFDTNIKEQAKKLELEIETRPLIICLGQNQILPPIDEFLTGKETGKYTIELEPEKAFGTRNRELIKIMPLKLFIEKKVMPQVGMVFQFDNVFGKVTSVSGGRVIVDFNNPLAGKFVVYEINIKKIVTDNREKVSTLMDFFFRKRFDFEIKEKKLIIKAPKGFKQFLQVFAPKFLEVLALELEIQESEPEKTESTPEKKQEKKVQAEKNSQNSI